MSQQIISDIATLKQTIQSAIDKHPSLCIVIDGPCASGKSTLASHLSNMFHIQVIAMDHFFLRPEQHTISRMNEIGGNIDYERFNTEVIANIQTLQPCTYHPYNCQQNTLEDPIPIQKPSLLIIEGVYSHHPKFYYPHALSIFLTIDANEQYQRLKKRNPHLFTKFCEEWIAKENEYFKHFDIQQQADIILEMKHFK